MLSGIFGSSDRASNARENSRFPTFVEVEAYWQALLERDGLPKRANLDPRGMRNALTKAFILDGSDPDVFRFRIVGSDISALHNGALHGRFLTDLIVKENQSVVMSIARDVVDLPAKATLDFSSRSQTGSEFGLRMGLFPLADADGRNTRLLGCLDFDGPTRTEQSGRLVLRGSMLRPLTRGRAPIGRRMHYQSLALVSRNVAPNRTSPGITKRPNLILVKG